MNDTSGTRWFVYWMFAKLGHNEIDDFRRNPCALQASNMAPMTVTVFRHVPLREVHPHAELAAEAAETAGAQRRYAEVAELDLERYDYEKGDHVYLQRVQEYMDGGTKCMVRSTPTFFVNGVVGDVSFGLENLQQTIEAELALRPYARRRR